jgi:hypothetical protein
VAVKAALVVEATSTTAVAMKEMHHIVKPMIVDMHLHLQ